MLPQCGGQKWRLTLNVQTFKLPAAIYSQNLNEPKSLNLHTFRKNCIFSILCNIEIWSKKNLKDNYIFYIYTKEQVLQMKIKFDYFVTKCKI
jgi:hypothetical protein